MSKKSFMNNPARIAAAIGTGGASELGIAAFNAFSPSTATPKESKQITVDGVTYNVPVDFNADIYSKEIDLENQMRLGLQGEEDAAQENVDLVGTQEAAALGDTRRNAAQALATQRGLVEGGRGLSLARGTANEASITEAKVRSDFATQLGSAKKEAAAAMTQRLAEEGKLLTASKERQALPALAMANIKEVEGRYRGDVFTTKSDYQQMTTELDALAAAATTPQEAAYYSQAANRSRAHKMPSEVKLT